MKSFLKEGSIRMLIRYKKTYEKIAMGLLSYMPKEHSVKELQEKIQQYETAETSELYLWKDGEDFIGLIGIKMGEEAYVVKDLALNPSFRGEGIGTEMVQALQKRYPDKACQSTTMTEPFIQRCHQIESRRAED